MRHIRFAHRIPARATLVGAAVAAVAILASACGSNTTENPPASDPTTTPPASSTPTSPVPKPVPTIPQTGGQSPTIPIDSAKLSGDGRTLTISYYIGPAACHGSLDKADVEQNASGVTVRLVRKLPPEQKTPIACIDMVELKTTNVTLDAPLGSRLLTDASTSKPVTVAA